MAAPPAVRRDHDDAVGYDVYWRNRDDNPTPGFQEPPGSSQAGHDCRCSWNPQLMARQATILREITRASRLAEAIEDHGASSAGFAVQCKALLAQQIAAFMQRSSQEDSA